MKYNWFPGVGKIRRQRSLLGRKFTIFCGGTEPRPAGQGNGTPSYLWNEVVLFGLSLDKRELKKFVNEELKFGKNHMDMDLLRFRNKATQNQDRCLGEL